MIAMLTKIDSGATSAQPLPRSRASAGRQAGGRQRDAQRLGRVERRVVELNHIGARTAWQSIAVATFDRCV